MRCFSAMATTDAAVRHVLEQRVRDLEHALAEARRHAIALQDRVMVAEKAARDAWTFARQLAPVSARRVRA